MYVILKTALYVHQAITVLMIPSTYMVSLVDRHECPEGMYVMLKTALNVHQAITALMIPSTYECPEGICYTEDCPLYTPGHYCPNDTINIHGIPCRSTYECPEGRRSQIPYIKD